MTSGSAIRRFIAAAMTLAAIDPFVPGVLAPAERARYEGRDVFRFESADLFAIGPVVHYLREHSRGDRPRSVFFGNSVVWGYGVRPEESLPVQFQRLAPDVRVFNFAVNGFGGGSAYLMLKNIIDAVDIVYLQVDGRTVNRGLARLMPISDEDIRRFALDRPNRLEEQLEGALGFWRLYGLSYRLQSAFFGSSTRNYLYANKSALVGGSRAAPSVTSAPNPPAGSDAVVIEHTADSDPTPARRQTLAAENPWLWEVASFTRAHGKPAVFWALDHPERAPTTDWAELNRVFRGSMVLVDIRVPPELRIDSRHLNGNGAAAVAGLLLAQTRALLDRR